MKSNLSSECSRGSISNEDIHNMRNFLPAPACFYENLYRNIEWNEENPLPVTLIKVLIAPKEKVQINSDCETSIINFATALNRSIRQSDFALRYSRLVFLFAVNTYGKAPEECRFCTFSLWRDEKFDFSYISADTRNRLITLS